MGNYSSKPTMPPSPPAASKELKDPWRPVKWSEKQELLKELEHLKPRLEPLRILVQGPVGAGKSCFINTVQRVLLGRNVSIALESSTTAIQGESFTLSFNPRGPIAKDDKRYNPRPSPGDRIHCLVNIVPADAISRLDDSVIDKMRTIRKKASEWSIPQVIVLTKVDNACEIVSQDLRKLYHSKKVKDKVEVSSHKLGIPLNNIYPMKNYHAEITEDTNVDVLILMALRDIVNFANDYVESMYESSDCIQS
ncbi:interferon-induced protein 44-like [Pygocentrus nattereri]|uniref:interferon-induced protein 44-like n=1 Tax=Pygocentrus nattereri TaxID=42514 RepID=UPI00189134F3|nr:interferon-induced protein 44-like [Pygocentrus nattereri]